MDDNNSEFSTRCNKTSNIRVMRLISIIVVMIINNIINIIIFILIIHDLGTLILVSGALTRFSSPTLKLLQETRRTV